MIIKAWAPSCRTQALKKLLGETNGADGRKVAAELARVRRLDELCRETGSLIDSSSGVSRNWAVLHGLTFTSHGKRVVIDHMLIGRTLDVWLYRSNRYDSGLKVTEDGDFLAWNEATRSYVGEASPLVEMEAIGNDLNRLLHDHELLPRRLGLKILPKIRTHVLTNPSHRLIRPERFDTSRVLKADRFFEPIQASIDDMRPLSAVEMVKVISRETLETFARAVAGHHNPDEINEAARLGVTRGVLANRTSAPTTVGDPTTKPTSRGQICPKCDDHRISIKHGRFGYFWACEACGKASSIELPGSSKLRKARSTFHLVDADGGESIFFVNAEK